MQKTNYPIEEAMDDIIVFLGGAKGTITNLAASDSEAIIGLLEKALDEWFVWENIPGVIQAVPVAKSNGKSPYYGGEADKETRNNSMMAIAECIATNKELFAAGGITIATFFPDLKTVKDEIKAAKEKGYKKVHLTNASIIIAEYLLKEEDMDLMNTSPVPFILKEYSDERVLFALENPVDKDAMMLYVVYRRDLTMNGYIKFMEENV